MEKICNPKVKASAENHGQAVANAMVHGELMQKEGLEGNMDMHLNLSENVRNEVNSREVPREMLKAHLKKVRGVTVQDKEMEKARQAAKKKLKSDGILRDVMVNASSGDWEADMVARKPKKSKARKVWSSAEESSDEEPIKPRKKTAKQARQPKDEKQIGHIRCVPGKPLYGLNGWVPQVRACGLSRELKETATTTGYCHAPTRATST